MTAKSKNSPWLSFRTLSFVVLACAIVVSGYLSYLKLDTGTTAACTAGEVFDCGTVLNSIYSEIAGVPIAWLGLGTNLLITALLLLEPRFDFFSQYTIPLVFGIVLFAFLFSVYLVYVQAFLIGKYCPYCLSHEAFITLLFWISTRRLMIWMNEENTNLAAE